jgi:hypothetical protein
MLDVKRLDIALHPRQSPLSPVPPSEAAVEAVFIGCEITLGVAETDRAAIPGAFLMRRSWHHAENQRRPCRLHRMRLKFLEGRQAGNLHCRLQPQTDSAAIWGKVSAREIDACARI